VIPPDPTPGDLQPWARRAFEDAYRRRPREQASREDVAYGFLRALVWALVLVRVRVPDWAGPAEETWSPTHRPNCYSRRC